MRVMLDTNILISAFVFRSKVIYRMIDYIVTDHELIMPTYVLEELRDVVSRKFPSKIIELDEFLTALSFTLAYTPQLIPLGLCEMRDESDYPIIYTAVIENVDVLVTGDKDFDDVDVEKPAIMSIATFVKTFM